jgi:hypothetical protein
MKEHHALSPIVEDADEVSWFCREVREEVMNFHVWQTNLP